MFDRLEYSQINVKFVLAGIGGILFLAGIIYLFIIF